MRQKGLDLRRPHVTRMPLARMPNKSFNPIDVSLLGAQTVVLESNLSPDLIQQTRCRASLGMRRYGVHFLGPTNKVQVTDGYQISTLPVFLYSLLDG